MTDRTAALEAVAEAARLFESDLSEYCDGPPRDALRASLAALAAAGPDGWRPIEEMPKCGIPTCSNPDCDWGPEIEVLVPPCQHYSHGPTIYVAHLEAGMWLVRDADDPVCWAELHCPPTRFRPLPPPPAPRDGGGE